MFKILAQEENSLIEKVAKAAFDILALEGDASVEFVEVGEDEIREINKKERGVDKVTDVLSFPMLDNISAFTKQNYPFDYDGEVEAVSLGSIIVCTEQARRQAEEYGHSLKREYAYLFLHGLLHLLGYDHETEAEREIMRGKEEEILTAVGVTR